MDQYHVITSTSTAVFETFQDAGNFAACIDFEHEPYAITLGEYVPYQGQNLRLINHVLVYESSPDKCVLCRCAKNLCSCEKEA